MALPEPGLVIPYGYLWHREYRRGVEEGRKTRPVVIIVVVQRAEGKTPLVRVFPITHTPPEKADEAIELPLRVKRELGLDTSRSWVILDESNVFAWPGYDLRHVPGAGDRFAYGFVPPRFLDAVIEKVIALAADRRENLVPRDGGVTKSD